MCDIQHIWAFPSCPQGQLDEHGLGPAFGGRSPANRMIPETTATGTDLPAILHTDLVGHTVA